MVESSEPNTLEKLKSLEPDKRCQELELVADFYFRLNTEIYTYMGCAKRKRMLTCDDLLDLMTDLLIEFESRVEKLTSGRMEYFDLVSKKLPRKDLGKLNDLFVLKKFKQLHPELFKEDLDDDDVIGLLVEKNLITFLNYQFLSRKGKSPREIINEAALQFRKVNKGISKFAFKTKIEGSPPAERPDSPKASLRKKKQTKKKKPSFKQKYPRVDGRKFYLNKKSRGKKITKEIVEKYPKLF